MYPPIYLLSFPLYSVSMKADTLMPMLVVELLGHGRSTRGEETSYHLGAFHSCVDVKCGGYGDFRA